MREGVVREKGGQKGVRGGKFSVMRHNDSDNKYRNRAPNYTAKNIFMSYKE